MRGAGELLGTRQSGLPEFRVGNLVRDIKILEMARKEAELYLTKRERSAETARMIQHVRSNARFGLAAVGYPASRPVIWRRRRHQHFKKFPPIFCPPSFFFLFFFPPLLSLSFSFRINQLLLFWFFSVEKKFFLFFFLFSPFVSGNKKENPIKKNNSNLY